MKKTILLFIAFLIGSISYAQTNNGFNYKAIVTDNGAPVANAIITVKVTFKQSGTLKWSEIHSSIHTDANGIFSINLGEGTREDGATTFADVWWGSESMTLTVEVDTGSGYQTLVEDEPLKPVPYAKTALKVSNDYFYNNTNDGSLRFIEPSVFGSNYIKHGSVGIEMGYWNLFAGQDEAYFKATNDNIWIKGELNRSETGDANLVPIAYGNISASGSITGGTGNFTVTHTDNSGVYLITLDNISDLSESNVVISAMPGQSGFQIYTRAYVNDDSSFYIKTTQYSDTTTSGDPEDSNIYFVVYKK